MILSAHQPAYIPWLGYFDKIARSDIFIYLDTVQFEKNSFINRNQIKTARGPIWLTVPVKTKGHLNSSLIMTEIDESQPWRTKHLRSIAMNYRKVPRFSEYFPKLENLINCSESNLSNYCFAQLNFWCRELGIKTKIVRASTLSLCTAKSDLVLDLCKHFDANHYLSGALGRNYLHEEDFFANGIKVQYQSFIYPVYPQLWGDFVPNLGVVDAWMNGVEIMKIIGELK